jgi:hypothetical protein
LVELVFSSAYAGHVSGMTTIEIGQSGGAGSQPLNGYIERIALFNSRLTNAQLQALTT